MAKKKAAVEETPKIEETTKEEAPIEPVSTETGADTGADSATTTAAGPGVEEPSPSLESPPTMAPPAEMTHVETIEEFTKFVEPPVKAVDISPPPPGMSRVECLQTRGSIHIGSASLSLKAGESVLVPNSTMAHLRRCGLIK